MVSMRPKSVHLTCLAPMSQKGFIINASAGSENLHSGISVIRTAASVAKKRQLSEHVGNDIYQQGG